MPMWRCPHCGTPQAEAARCWVCRRSSTTCSTCRHFRASLAANVGYCGLDRRRAPLQGDEHRGCWTAPALTADLLPGEVTPLEGFVPIELLRDGPIASEARDGWTDRISLFGDLDA